MPSCGEPLPVGGFARAWGIISFLFLGSETFQRRKTRCEQLDERALPTHMEIGGDMLAPPTQDFPSDGGDWI